MSDKKMTQEQAVEKFCKDYDFKKEDVLEDGLLDEMVHDAFSNAASNVNNAGLNAQLEELLGVKIDG